MLYKKHFKVHQIRPIILYFFKLIMIIMKSLVHHYTVSKNVILKAHSWQKTCKLHVSLWLKYGTGQTQVFIPSFLLAHSR